MTQKERIIKFLSDNLGKGFTARKLQSELKFKLFTSLRGRLSELKKSKRIKSRKSRILRRLEYFIEELFFRKIVKASFETAGFSPYGITYEDNKTNRAKFLIKKISTETNPIIRLENIPQALDDGIKNYKPNITVDALTWGYDDNQTDDNPPTRLIFPKFEVGIE